ncbi:BON domain-containing protein [Gloeobacter kilaueensis]|uniref:Outer membrane lipoprotein n=1 Tax=Gloeobacter kilaueensis (strain ATCC BAA-2537 / CCAP 1431/1 / ULC 316 / JS1) TaxID=1183438 RepID=U5QKZ9_GLOK1|nr:BON domain-containing protein [Gloeobacter kilaueensis]AGY59667.1 outer membrane lipoprotein [Gloeobacter kilaueensis JS1]
MKKTQALLLSLPLILGLAACSNPNPNAEGVRQDQVASNERAENQRQDAANSTGDAANNAGNAAGQAAGNAGQQANSAVGNTDGAQTAGSGESPADASKDAASDTRKRQLNSDIRAREQREDRTGKVSDGDLESKVRSKLEANIQQSRIAVTAKEGTVTLKGKVPTEADITKATTLTKEIQGVKQVQSELTTGKG